MRFETEHGPVTVDPLVVIVAGFTGRDEAEVRRHLVELAEMGVSVPEQVPTFYPVPPLLAVQEEDIVVSHEATSGEAEPMLVVADGRRYLTLASDHTDRRAETEDIHRSKLLCPKVIARRAWPLTDVVGHWDRLRIRSWIVEGGERVLYQEGMLEQLLPLEILLERAGVERLPHNYALLAGTLPAIGGIRPSRVFDAELWDPEHGGSIHLSYSIEVLDRSGVRR